MEPSVMYVVCVCVYIYTLTRPRPAGVFMRGTLAVTVQILSLVSEGTCLPIKNKIFMECCLLSEPKVRGYRKHMLKFVDE